MITSILSSTGIDINAAVENPATAKEMAHNYAIVLSKLTQLQKKSSAKIAKLLLSGWSRHRRDDLHKVGVAGLPTLLQIIDFQYFKCTHLNQIPIWTLGLKSSLRTYLFCVIYSIKLRNICLRFHLAAFSCKKHRSVSLIKQF